MVKCTECYQDMEEKYEDEEVYYCPDCGFVRNFEDEDVIDIDIRKARGEG